MLSVEISRKKAPLVKMYLAALGVKAYSTECYNNILIILDDPAPAPDVMKSANLFLELLDAFPDESAVPAPVKMITEKEIDALYCYYDDCNIEETEERDAFFNVLNMLGIKGAFDDYKRKIQEILEK